MRIVSKFKDYYDGVAACGAYGGVQYIRETKRIVTRKFQGGRRYDLLDYITIGFCGKLYPCYHTREIRDYECTYFYKEEEVLKYYDEHQETGKYYYRQSERNIKELFERMRHQSISKIFDEYKCPCFITMTDYGKSENVIILNPCLRVYQFFKVVDAYTAFQELAMFMSNMASPEKPIPQINDDDMRDIKGFNKYSFRKDKSIKK